jgi:hypothetical protein
VQALKLWLLCADLAAGWGTILVMADVSLSVLSVIIYIALTYHPINVSSSCTHCMSSGPAQTVLEMASSENK